VESKSSESNSIAPSNFLEFSLESEIRIANYKSQISHAEKLWDVLLSLLARDDAKLATETKDFAANIGYNHPGLTASQYFLHPFRVGALSGIENPSDRVNSTMVGLLHNILEVGTLPRSEIEKKFGAIFVNVLETLTIDRKLQNNKIYLEGYYAQIAELPGNLGVIKVIDKLDNLYSLHRTATPSVKVTYMLEVNNFLVPLCEKVSPHLTNTLKGVVDAIESSN